jgi:ATP phosphoribosyltransferase regulatory subunit
LFSGGVESKLIAFLMRKTHALAPGVQYLDGAGTRSRREILERFHQTFRGWSYQEIVLPVIDYAESFQVALGPEAQQGMYSFVDRDGSLLALRPDITPLVAKAVASADPDELPRRLWYDGEVFRYERPRAGQQREFYQVGIELIGSDSVKAEVEVLLVLLESLQRAGLESIVIPLGHAEFFNGLVEGLQLGAEDAAQLKNLIDHKNSWGIRQMLLRIDVAPIKRDFLIALPRLSGRREVLERADPAVQNARSRRALERMAAIFEELSSLGLSEYFLMDLGEVRNLEYYTGLIFKVYTRNLGFELGGGGRYDTLLGRFGRAQPAVGFSIGLERLLAALAPQAAPGEHASVSDNFSSAMEWRRQDRVVRMEWS